jgi:hypothetical protein
MIGNDKSSCAYLILDIIPGTLADSKRIRPDAKTSKVKIIWLIP